MKRIINAISRITSPLAMLEAKLISVATCMQQVISNVHMTRMI